VDVFEQRDLAGGMVSAAIPSFRLTSESIESDIRRILASGVQLHDNQVIDKARFKALQDQYNAVFLAIGAQRSVPLKIDGAATVGVLDPLAFLYAVNQDRPAHTGRHVVIIGGGNTAMDAARTAYRLVGNEGTVTVVYRRTIREMPADKGEIEAVLREGIRIMELTTPVKITSQNNRVAALVCLRNTLAIKGADGRPVPVSIPGSEFEISCDTVIPAIGQELDVDFLAPEALRTTPGSYQTQLPGVYIGGDAMRGASTAINAIGDGRKAAAEILRSLGVTADFSDASRSVTAADGGSDIKALLHRKATREYGIHPEETAPDQRRNFDLVISSLDEADARKEAARCLQCNTICNVCVSVCPNLANYGYQTSPVYYNLQKAVLEEGGEMKFLHDREFRIGQHYQVLNIRDLCNECGNCTAFCPTNGRPFADKPGICLSVETLNREGAGFYLSRLPDRTVLVHKEQEHVKTLTRTGDHLIYETDQVKAVINPGDFSLAEVTFLTPCVREFRFEFAAEMSVIMNGLEHAPLTYET
jgi:putative selenate reductase